MSDTTTSPPPRPRFSGIVPPLVTPLRDGDSIDEPGTVRLLERVIAGGVHGVFILGTTGEAPSLGYRLRRDFIELVCRTVGHRVPVLVGITDTAFVESIGLAEVAVAAGADAVVLSTPYYFPAGQTELRTYIHHMAERLPLPLVLYNMPSLTKVWFEFDTLRELTEIDCIMGVKDSSGDCDYFARIVSLKSQRPDWSIFMGPEELLVESLGLGGDGGVCGGANVFPELFVGCYEAVRSGDAAKVALHAARIRDLQAIYSVGKYASRFIKATKCALSLLGICEDHTAEPFHHFLAPERARVDAILRPLTGGDDDAEGVS